MKGLKKVLIAYAAAVLGFLGLYLAGVEVDQEDLERCAPWHAGSETLVCYERGESHPSIPVIQVIEAVQ